MKGEYMAEQEEKKGGMLFRIVIILIILIIILLLLLRGCIKCPRPEQQTPRTGPEAPVTEEVKGAPKTPKYEVQLKIVNDKGEPLPMRTHFYFYKAGDRDTVITEGAENPCTVMVPAGTWGIRAEYGPHGNTIELKKAGYTVSAVKQNEPVVFTLNPITVNVKTIMGPGMPATDAYHCWTYVYNSNDKKLEKPID